MSFHKLPRLVALCLALSACNDPAEPNASAAGSWSGVRAGITVTLEITQSGSALSGIGAYDYAAGGSTGSLNLTGSYSRPNITLTMSGAGTGPAPMPRGFTGTVAGDGRTMTGRLEFPGAAIEDFTLTKR